MLQLVALWLGLTTQPMTDNTILQVGIVQRFGERPSDRVVISSVSDVPLQVSFVGDGQNLQTATVPELVVTVTSQPLAQPVTEEKIVISHHRSFENAAATAYRLQNLGVVTEIAQPRRWQVWAHRSIYHSSILRSLLVSLLQKNGFPQVQTERRIVTARTLLSWQIGNVRYQRQGLEITTANQRVLVNGRLYGGNLRLQPNAYGSFTVVNLVPLETYLRGVVPHEIGFKAPYATVQAQAVLARTYALASRHRFTIDNYELCADTQCQVYKGLQDTSPIADRAIAETRGQVLTHEGKVIDALYSSTTGGITANYLDVWDGNPRPYLQSVIDLVNPPFSLEQLNLRNENNFRNFLDRRPQFPFNEQGWLQFSWQKESSLGEITADLRAFLQMNGDRRPLRQVTTLRVSDRASSGRVQAITATTDVGEIVIRKDEIIDAFRAPNSLFFYLEPIRENNRIIGYRWIGGGLGHGVGMSQTGAYRLAKMGWSYDRILAFYYRGAQLRTLGKDTIAVGSNVALPHLTGIISSVLPFSRLATQPLN
ncbi:MAG: SpoIID/LytB domain-containing protein [Pseudanabaenaceae cyanobacterium]